MPPRSWMARPVTGPETRQRPGSGPIAELLATYRWKCSRRRYSDEAVVLLGCHGFILGSVPVSVAREGPGVVPDIPLGGIALSWLLG